MKRKRSSKITFLLILVAIATLILLGVTSWPYIQYRIAVSKLNDKLSDYKAGKTILVFDPDFPIELKNDFTGSNSILDIQPFAYVHINKFNKPQIEFSDGTRRHYRRPIRDENSQEATVFIEAIDYLNLNWGDSDCTIICFSHDMTLRTSYLVFAINYKKWPFLVVTSNQKEFPKEHPMNKMAGPDRMEIFYLDVPQKKE